MKRFFRSWWFKAPFYFFVSIFCLVGLFFTATFIGIQLNLTRDGGAVDINNRYFQDIKDKYNQAYKSDTSKVDYNDYMVYERILLLNKFYPKNANYILAAYQENQDEVETMRMIEVAEIQLQKDKKYQKAKRELLHKLKSAGRKPNNKSVYDWMNIAEWQDFKEAVGKDKHHIDSVSNVLGVESRLIVACLVGEQIRLFNSKREAYKKWIGPLKILSVETQFSFGVTGIKELTAQKIEAYLKDSTSSYYLGKKYEHVLDFKTEDIMTERMDRLTSYRNHFYSYMYAGAFLKQVRNQWKRHKFPIDDRPEILATLFNLGFPKSKPNADPQVGGATIQIYETPHTFGSIAYQFYYSGELFDLFPITSKKFDFNEN